MQKPFTRISIILAAIFLLVVVSACQPVATAPAAKPPAQNPPTQAADLSTGGSLSGSGSAAEVTPTSEPSSGAKTFIIDSQFSEVRFRVDEVLRGEDVTVVGVTDEVSGQFTVDYADLAATTASTIEIGAGSLTTDESRRNTAIRNFILQTSTYPKIVFTPIEISGLSGSAAVGESYSFQIAGNLTIRDITQPTVFEVTVTVISETQLNGSVVSSIQRSDYNLTIPSVPFVASVDETVHIEIDLAGFAQ